MTILVTGKLGQLGSELQDLEKSYPYHQFIFTDIDNLDITKQSKVNQFFKSNAIEALINCAAYTAVDKADSEPELVNAVNHLGVKYLAEACKLHGIKMVHISTDYVFDGEATKPYVESDRPNPQSVYGQSKLDGELALKAINPANSIIIRTAWVYSVYGHNFVKTMLRLGKEQERIQVVNDQIGAPTHAADLAKTILEFLPKIKNAKVETYHYTNAGQCTWYDFAKAIFKNTNLLCKVEPISTSAYPIAAKRPQYSVLDTTKIQNRFQLDINNWQVALHNCLERLK